MKKFVICIFQLILLLNTTITASEQANTTQNLSESKQIIQIPSFADIVEPLMPAVVNVYTIKHNVKSEKSSLHFPEGSPFEQFNELFGQFDNHFNFDELYTNPKAVSLGSGFIIDATGYIVTNYHVINGADEVNIKLLDNTEIPAKVVGSDKRTDLALLKIDAKQPLPFVKFGDEGVARVGDWVIAIGNPFGLGGTVTTGIISSKARDIDTTSDSIVDNFLQTDAAINRGNSGGPMFNINGEVIGINSSIFSPSGTNIGIGFAIPASTAQKVIAQLKTGQKIIRGKLGVVLQEITSDIAEGLGIKENTGALVSDVIAGDPADNAGVKPGDIIIEFAGQKIQAIRKLQVLVAESPIDKDLSVVLMRNGKRINITVRLVDSDNYVSSVKTSSVIVQGIIFSDLTKELQSKYSINDEVKGIIITKVPKSLAFYGLKIGDVVVKINQQLISNIAAFDKIYQEAKNAKKKNIVLFIKRNSNINIVVALPIDS